MKGEYNQECNRTACNNLNATYYNHSTEKYYCRPCAKEINYWNKAAAIRLFGHDLCTEVIDLKKVPDTFDPNNFKEIK